MGDEKKTITLTVDGMSFTGEVTIGADSGWSGHLSGESGGFIDLKKGVLEGDNLKSGTVRFSNGNVYEGKFSYERPEDLMGKLTYANGDIYEGEFSNGQPHGDGKLTYKNGAVYKGKFSGGNPHGKGKFTYSSGRVCEGEFSYIKKHAPTTDILLYEGLSSGGKRQGWGKLTYKNGDVYGGEFSNGQPWGKGKITYKNGDIYEGEFSEGKPDGEGKFIYKKSGDIYEGYFSGWKPHGKGKRTYKESGDVYEGYFSGRKPHGKGKRTYKNGDVYEGDWKYGNRDGHGTLTYKNGDVYEGDWKYGNRDGHGKLTYTGGAVWEGGFSDGQPQGSGKFIHSDGRVCKGEFSYIKKHAPTTDILLYEGLSSGGKRQGWGKITYKNGDVYEGELSNGQLQGKGKRTYENRDVYEGDFSGGKPHGKGKLIYPNGDVWEGNWKDGKRDGQGKLIYPNGDVWEGNWKDGKRDGHGKLTSKNGTVYEGEFSGGQFQGKGKLTYLDGKVCEGEFSYIKEYDPTTDISSYEGLSSGGKRQGWGKLVYTNGDVYEGEFSDGQPQGQGKLTYADGDVYGGEFSDGQPDGEGKLIYENNDVYEGQFSRGERHGHGKLTQAGGKVQEGEFSEDKVQRIFSRDPENGLNYYKTYDSLGRLTSLQLLSGEPERDEYKKVKTDDTSVAKLKLLFREVIESENVEYFSYGEGGSLKKRLEVNYDKINRLLSSGDAKNLEDLVAGGALVVRDGADTQLNISAASAAEIKEFLLASVKGMAKLRSAKGAEGFSGGRSPEYQAAILSMVEGENLGNVRFSTGKTSYSSMTSFLESMGIDKKNLKKTEAKYISLDADTDLGDHAVCLTVDLEKIRKDVEAHGWDELNKSTGTYVLCFDSSRVVGHPDYKGNFGKIGENLRFMNKDMQEEGSCWFHSETSVLTTVENPRVMEKMFSGETKTYGLGEEGNIGDPNEIMVLQMQKLQSVADALGVNLKDGRFLVEGIVKEELIERVAGLAKDGALLEDLNKRIREKFEKFEKELKDKNAGVEDVEYKNYKAKITEEHKKKLREEIKNIPLKEKAKQSPKFVENLKKLEEVNRQINNLENRLNAGLERFNRENGETGKLSIVDILRKNEKEREKNENGKENIAGTSTVLNTLSQSCTTVPGSNIPTSNATQKANINTNTKETSFS